MLYEANLTMGRLVRYTCGTIVLVSRLNVCDGIVRVNTQAFTSMVNSAE